VNKVARPPSKRRLEGYVSFFPRRTLAMAAASALALAPAVAVAERIVTKQGEVIVGDPRFEGDELVVRRADGTEVRIPRQEIERIELENGAAPPPAAAPAPRNGTPRPRNGAPPPPAQRPPPAPRYPRYVPPPPPPPPPSVGRRMLESTGFRSGLGLKLGYQRGLDVGLEWQQRVARYVGVGLGGQVALATNGDVACPTWGGTGRLYLGNEHRFAAEAGIGLNRIDPYLDRAGSRAPSCGRSEMNIGPEFSAGYQFASRTGFLFETLAGFAPLTNEDLADAHGAIVPLFQINFGFVFR
jgi:hypothetical protein